MGHSAHHKEFLTAAGEIQAAAFLSNRIKLIDFNLAMVGVGIGINTALNVNYADKADANTRRTNTLDLRQSELIEKL